MGSGFDEIPPLYSPREAGENEKTNWGSGIGLPLQVNFLI
jgi:hypothetical protein